MTARRSGRRPAVVAVLAVVLTAVVTGCGIPLDNQPRDIRPSERPDLGQAAAEATGLPADARGPQLFFLSGAGSRGEERLVAANRSLPATLPAVIGALLGGVTQEEQGRKLRSAIPAGTTLRSARVVDGGTAVIDLDRTFDQTQGDAQRKAVAQLVYTATQVEGVTQVQLLVDGKAREWPRGDGFFQKEPLTPYAYPDLDPSTQPEFPPLPGS